MAFNIDTQKITEYSEWAGLNVAWATISYAMFTNSITWIIGIVGGITLIWFNVERALKARQERQMLNKPKEDEQAN
jgi:Flp pilus assembly protein TadB